MVIRISEGRRRNGGVVTEAMLDGGLFVLEVLLAGLLVLGDLEMREICDDRSVRLIDAGLAGFRSWKELLRRFLRPRRWNFRILKTRGILTAL